MNDAAGHARVIRASFEGQYIMRPGSQYLDRVGVAKVLPNAEHCGVETQRSFRIAYRQSQVRQTVGMIIGVSRLPDVRPWSDAVSLVSRIQRYNFFR